MPVECLGESHEMGQIRRQVTDDLLTSVAETRNTSDDDNAHLGLIHLEHGEEGRWSVVLNKDRQ